MRLAGYPVSPGIAFGRARVVRTQEISVQKRPVPPEEAEAEVARLEGALTRSAEQVRNQKEQARSRMVDDLLDLYDAHVAILQDPALLHGASARIRRDLVNAEFALQAVVKDMVHGLLSTGDSYFQERASDLEDLHRQVQGTLAGTVPQETCIWGRDVVVLADSLSLADSGTFHNPSLRAFATEHGGRTSHTAILARSLEIPAVVAVHGLTGFASPDVEVIVDGLDGAVILDPTAEERAEYEEKVLAWRTRRENMMAGAREDAYTLDGHRIQITANIDLLPETENAVRYGAEGVGLYRSEFLFLEKAPRFPTEEEHAACYARLAEDFYPHRVVVRTLDLGGEKYFHGVLEKGEPNPVLGLRAIRICLKRPDIFKPQLRGLLRASVRKNLSILLPFITTLEELLETRAVLEEVKGELRSEGVPFHEDVPLGIMVEVPSCALCIDAFVPYADFFSIGTNDLVQYLMAVDRNNESVAPLHDPLHPAVLRCIAQVCHAAEVAKKPVSVCGEAAADPRMIPLLVGLGVTELSMTPSVLMDAKESVRGLSWNRCHRLARHALKAPTGRSVEEMVEHFLRGRAAHPRRQVPPPSG
jgi:phosphoenolpyruvate-protein phosphotransferase (PTS system enzyme I)